MGGVAGRLVVTMGLFGRRRGALRPFAHLSMNLARLRPAPTRKTARAVDDETTRSSGCSDGPAGCSTTSRSCQVSSGSVVVQHCIDLTELGFSGLLLSQVDDEKVTVALFEAGPLGPLEFERELDFLASGVHPLERASYARECIRYLYLDLVLSKRFLLTEPSDQRVRRPKATAHGAVLQRNLEDDPDLRDGVTQIRTVGVGWTQVLRDQELEIHRRRQLVLGKVTLYLRLLTLQR